MWMKSSSAGEAPSLRLARNRPSSILTFHFVYVLFCFLDHRYIGTIDHLIQKNSRVQEAFRFYPLQILHSFPMFSVDACSVQPRY